MKTIDEQIDEVLEAAGVNPNSKTDTSDFSLKKLSEINTLGGVVYYCSQYLEKIGSGSSRVAFKIDNEKILKVAKNRKGIAQNNTEINGGLDIYPEVFAQIYEADWQNDMWLEMERANRVKEQDFQDCFGLSSEEVFALMHECYCSIHNEKNNRKTENTDKLFQELVLNEGSKWFYQYYMFMSDFELNSVYDFYRFSNWGTVMRDGSKCLVIIDNGLNDEVAHQFYGRK